MLASKYGGKHFEKVIQKVKNELTINELKPIKPSAEILKTQKTIPQ